MCSCCGWQLSSPQQCPCCTWGDMSFVWSVFFSNYFYSETNTYTMLPHPHHISPGSAPEHFDSCRANSCAFLLVTITHRDTQPQPHTHFFSNSKVDSGMLIIVKWGSQQVLLVFKYKREINLQTLTIIDIEMKNLKLVS